MSTSDDSDIENVQLILIFINKVKVYKFLVSLKGQLQKK